MLYKKAEIENISTLFVTQDELKDLYEFLRGRIEDNKDYNVSTLFDSFEIKSNSLIDKVINYNFPENYREFLSDTIKKVRIYELETEKGIKIDFDSIDKIIENVITVALRRFK